LEISKRCIKPAVREQPEALQKFPFSPGEKAGMRASVKLTIPFSTLKLPNSQTLQLYRLHQLVFFGEGFGASVWDMWISKLLRAINNALENSS